MPVASGQTMWRPRAEAVIVDMDGTLENMDGSINDAGMAYVEEHYRCARTIIVVTARDHEHSFDYTHEWLRHFMPVPFIGPFCRAIGDRRHAVEFKRDVHAHLSGLFEIVGAIDDNPFVLEMWSKLGLKTVQAFDSPTRLPVDYLGDL